MSDLFSSPSAVISRCGKYRYRLERDSLGTGQTAIIMVNPSTADATDNDATIRKLLGFGRNYGWGRIVVGNLFAYRATDVRELATVDDPVGPDNDQHLRDILSGANQIVFAWGPTTKLPKRLRDRWKSVASVADEISGGRMYSIGDPAKDGQPCHPLILPYSRKLQPWSRP